MIVKRITTFILRAPIARRAFYSSQARFPERNSLLAKIETNGLIDWGEGSKLTMNVVKFGVNRLFNGY